MISVLLCDDSQLVRMTLKEILETDPEIVVIGEAENGLEGVELTKRLGPDLVIMDIEMPEMDGIEATRVIMSETPTPILIFTTPHVFESRNVPFEGIQAGALEVLRKPENEMLRSISSRSFIRQVKVLSRVPVYKLSRRKNSTEAGVTRRAKIPRPKVSANILAIAASTGGPKALASILKALPNFIPFTILIVQHIGRDFTEGLTLWLQTFTQVPVRIPKGGESLLPNSIFVCPGGMHMMVRGNRIALDDSPPVNSCKPSADVLFGSLAERHSGSVIALQLTGIGNDGARGLLGLREAGMLTIAQDEGSSIVFGMPKVAIDLGGAVHVLSLQEMPSAILPLFGL